MRQLKITQSITNRTPILEKYFDEVNKEELITQEEEIELAERIKNLKDPVACDKLVRANLRFVISVAKQYQTKNNTLSDLINDGNAGLIKAASLFDHSKGFKFISYAVWWIRQSIIEGKSKNDKIVRLPGNKIAMLNKIRKETNRLEQKLERTPYPDEICDSLNIDLESYFDSMKGDGSHSSLDQKVGEDESQTILDLISDKTQMADEFVNIESLKFDLKRALSCLDERQKKIIKLFFGFGDNMQHQPPKSLEEISSLVDGDLTTERIRQLKEQALKKLQKSSSKNALRKYFLS